jgi:predicted nucleic acid-binding protein
MSLDAPDLFRIISKLHIWPIDLAACRGILRLDFRGDSADEIIAATSLVHDVPLVTRDRVVKRSKIVRCA